MSFQFLNPFNMLGRSASEPQQNTSSSSALALLDDRQWAENQAQKQMDYQTNASQIQMDYQTGASQKQMDYQTEASQKQMDFQERMSNTSYQRAVADLQAAGLNPALAYMQGGASSSSGASGNGASGNGASGSGSSANTSSTSQKAHQFNTDMAYKYFNSALQAFTKILS